MTYNNEEILPGVWWYIFKYFQHINHILASIELAGAQISEEKLHWYYNDIIMIGYAYNYDNYHFKMAKIAKIIKWSLCMNITEVRIFIDVCVYYQIWIKDFVVIA